MSLVKSWPCLWFKFCPCPRTSVHIRVVRRHRQHSGGPTLTSPPTFGWSDSDVTANIQVVPLRRHRQHSVVRRHRQHSVVRRDRQDSGGPTSPPTFIFLLLWYSQQREGQRSFVFLGTLYAQRQPVVRPLFTLHDCIWQKPLNPMKVHCPGQQTFCSC